MSNRPDTSKPSLRTLSFMLRNRETWPPGFVWKFSHCTRCAMGLAYRVWPQAVHEPTCGDMSNAFHLGPGVAMALFTHGIHEEVSPEAIADRIDNYLERV